MRLRPLKSHSYVIARQNYHSAYHYRKTIQLECLPNKF
jgi:hypothetical protein